MKELIQRVINTLGYNIARIPSNNEVVKHDLSLYLKLYSEEAVINRRFYNIGAGTFRHEAWTNVDHQNEWYKKNNVDIDLDFLLLNPLPIKDNSAEVVYSSHTVEHITDLAAQNLFNESHRVLKVGGYLRIATPNIDLDYRAYKSNDRDYFYWCKRYATPEEYQRVKACKPFSEWSIQQTFLYHFATSASTLHIDGSPMRISDAELDMIFNSTTYINALNYCTSRCSLDVQRKYPGNHINWWNKGKLFKTLKIAGFDSIYLSGYGQSYCPILRDTLLFDNTHPKISLYVEAIKGRSYDW